jgi:hypothetical protein
VIAAAGFSSFRELYHHILQQGGQHDEYYSITYVDREGNIRNLVVPVWKIMTSSIHEICRIRKRWRRK